MRTLAARGGLIVTLLAAVLSGNGLAQIGPGPVMVPLSAVAPPSVQVVLVSSGTQAQVSGNATFTSQNFGPAAANRYIVIGTTALTTVTVGGVSATKMVSVTSSNGTSALWVAAVPTGTSGTVVVNGSGSQTTAFAAYSMIGNASPTPGATNTSTTNPPSASIAIPTRGVAIAFCLSENGATPVWTGLTGDVDLFIDNSHPRTAAAHLAVNAGATPTAQCSSAGNNGVNAMVLASWGP